MESLTPIDPNQRGAHLSIKLSKYAKEMFKEVEKRGILVNFILFLFDLNWLVILSFLFTINF